MSNYFGISSDSVSTLFSSLGSSASSSTGNILATYASIKNGSYYKLTKAYYAKTGNTETASSKDKDTAKELNRIKQNAEGLYDASEALLENKKSKTLFKEVESTDSEGNKTTDYDREGIYKALVSFADSYNDTIDSAEDANTTSILTAASSMTKASATNTNLLKQVGITIGNDNHLSVDKDTFMKADMNTVKTLFQGNGSYAYSVKANASYMSISATNAANKSTTYNSNGGYTSLEYSSMIDSIV